MITGKYTAATAVMTLLASACAAENDQSPAPANEPGAAERAEEAAATAGDILEDAGEAIAEGAEDVASTVGAAVQKELDDINALGLTLRNILNEEVSTRDGGVAAKVDDILFEENGRPALVILREGGFFGAEEDKIIVTVQRLRITQIAGGEISVEITLTEDEIEKLGDGIGFLPADFSVGGDIDTSLLSAQKMLDTSVFNSEDEKIADVYDLVLNREWRFDQVIVSTGGLGEMGDRLVAAPWRMFTLRQDRTTLRTTRAAVDFDALTPFQYSDLIE